ncbi:MAG: flavin reductase family protein [Ktedonobacteraceae bacterium]|nr:flavin reductase family protein [Ktedonobacteraceae bacterium]
MAIEKNFFRQVMGRFATGVTVVTTRGSEGVAGLTVNAFCSVSLEPPLVLVCVDLQSVTLPAIRESGAFAVNILTDQQEELSRCFAMASEERYTHFCHATYHVAATNSPILDGALAFVDARIVAEYPGGDHVIFIGQVAAIGTGNQVIFADETDQLHATAGRQNGTSVDHSQRPPLAYYLGQYRHLAPGYQKPSLPVTAQSQEKASD